MLYWGAITYKKEIRIKSNEAAKFEEITCKTGFRAQNTLIPGLLCATRPQPTLGRATSLW